VLFLGFLAVAMTLGWWWIHRSIPPLDGTIPLPGLDSRVDVRFDRFAIPHLYAGPDEDAWEAVGYLQGRDRFWQMELYRRAASGRLSEVLGEGTVAIDQRFLTLGLRRAAEIEWGRTTPRVRIAFERYAAGVNAAMAAGGGKRPLELQLLRLQPEPWTPIDSLAIGKLFAWRLGENHTAELLRYSLLQALGPRAGELLPAPPEWAPTILEPVQGNDERAGGKGLRAEGRTRVATVDSRHRLSTDDSRLSTLDSLLTTPLAYPPGLEWLSPDHSAMSNSWVVSGSRTSSGRPLLANDPHLVIEMPSVWWEVHVVSDTLNVAGVTIPGIPFVIIGHNERLGWGLTNVGADVQDFFIEQLDPSRQRYRSGDAWLPLHITRHQIRVSGRDEPIAFDVRATRHGPILSLDAWREPQPGAPAEANPLSDTVLALRWEAVVEGESAAAFDALARATNWMEFVSAVRLFSAPAQNFVYADVDGNIGYAMSGLLPIRAGSDGSIPAPGWTNEAGWRGSIATGDLPTVLNPRSGQIVTANNEVDRRFPHGITRDWVAPFRAKRIIDLLGDSQGLDIGALARIHADVTSLSADFILKAVDGPAVPEDLRRWDRRVDGRPASLLYEVFEEALWRRTFADEMSAPLYDRFYRYAANERFAGLRAIVADRNSQWFDDRTTPDVHETRDDIVFKAADDALTSLRSRFGDASNWRWDQIHALKFSHALSGGGRLLDWFFSRGPVPVAGDSMTVNKTTTDLRRPYQTSEAASYRQILDVGAWDGSVAVNTTGQSGHPRSPHYFDQNRLWRQGYYHPLPFTRGAVDAATVSRLELVATGSGAR
jgi:penicillin amidase